MGGPCRSRCAYGGITREHAARVEVERCASGLGVWDCGGAGVLRWRLRPSFGWRRRVRVRWLGLRRRIVRVCGSQAASRGEGGHRWRAGNVAPRTWRGTLLVAIGCGWEGQAVWLSCSAAQMACSVWRPRLRSGAQVRV